MMSTSIIVTSFAITVGLLLFLCVPPISCHGRLMEPPSRASMWRYGFNNPPDYTDTQGYCGGLQKKMKMGGKCGICGDPYDARRPRPHEAGGQFGRGTIVRKWKSGQEITAKVDLTANHNGYFEFKICPTNNKAVEATEACLNRYKLRLANGQGTRYTLPSTKNQIFSVKLRLPAGLKCTHCVFQWSYNGANNWGTCPNGKEKIGCGPQEEFRACADVSIN